MKIVKDSGKALQLALHEVSEELQEVMERLLPDPSGRSSTVISLADRNLAEEGGDVGGEATVMEAMRYSTLSGGKRLRPFLTVACASLFGVSRQTSLHAAAAMEFIHTYSLIHDDLPAMDDDPLRRGMPSCHIRFGEATAILAGDALQALAFQVLADPNVHPDPNVRCDLVRSLARAAGWRGLCGGQMMDLEAENKELSVDEIIRLQRLKTGEMFAVACEAGAILGKAPEPQRRALQRFAHDMGLSFQITDDLLDAEGTREEAGKEVNKDKRRGKATLVSSMGVERAREQAKILARQAAQHLSCFDKKAEVLRQLAEYAVSRRS
jgi:farnesyl diphosphate synthase